MGDKGKAAEIRVRRSTRNQGKRKEREGAATPDSEHPEQVREEDAVRRNLTQRDRHERGEGSGDEGPSSREGASYANGKGCLLYTSPSPRDKRQSRMPSSA